MTNLDATIPHEYEVVDVAIPTPPVPATVQNLLEKTLIDNSATHILTTKGEVRKWMGWVNRASIPVQKRASIERIPYERVHAFLRVSTTKEEKQ